MLTSADLNIVSNEKCVRSFTFASLSTVPKLSQDDFFLIDQAIIRNKLLITHKIYWPKTFACLIINIFMHVYIQTVLLSNSFCCCIRLCSLSIIHSIYSSYLHAKINHSKTGIIVNTEPLLCYQMIFQLMIWRF